MTDKDKSNKETLPDGEWQKSNKADLPDGSQDTRSGELREKDLETVSGGLIKLQKKFKF